MTTENARRTLFPLREERSVRQSLQGLGERKTGSRGRKVGKWRRQAKKREDMPHRSIASQQEQEAKEIA
ncbi:hypothetical protein B296_00015841 [Ensete ventricosum]|uniref:Uncharacterized protein n=1 Tax=Ensete ventricosum TaxID=4639 RepID=A0A427B2F7_ENSVE|nr:hypothetical protein B296_00015841 [Ensete ventricosum]